MTTDPYLWTTRDGTRIDVRTMKHDHLRNALRLLYRAATAKECIELYGLPDDDGAGYGGRETPTETVLRFYPDKGKVLLDEWARREIDRPETDYRPNAWAYGDPKMGQLIGALLDVALGGTKSKEG